MQATKDHISLETSKLILESGVKIETDNAWIDFWNNSTTCGAEGCDCKNGKYHKTRFADYVYNFNIEEWESRNHIEIINIFPGFTWQEILWEYPEEFFGNDGSILVDITNTNLEPKYVSKIIYIVLCLQKGEYQEADEYFKKHCILINKKAIGKNT